MNSRTLNQPDFIFDDDCQFVPTPPPELYEPGGLGCDLRNNVDKGYNNYGPKFLDLCKRIPLRILNGRTLGDLAGNLTCFTARGSSTVDYGAVSPEIMKKVRFFRVEPLMPICSDHCPITLCLKVKANIDIARKVYNFKNKPDKVIWDKTKNHHFCDLLSSEENKFKIKEHFSKIGFQSQESIEDSVEFITNLLVSTSEIAGMMVKKGIKPRKPPIKNRFVNVKPPKWHDQTCHELFLGVKQTAKLLSKNPKNAWLKGKLNMEVKHYNKKLKAKHKEFIDSTFKDLESMHKADPRGYMALVKALREGTSDIENKTSDTDSIEPDEWFDHFNNLLGKVKNQTFDEKELKDFIDSNLKDSASELDEPFTLDELKAAVKKLKNNKAGSFDMICNEMIKSSFETLSSQYICIFNSILSSNCYPRV